MRGVLQSAPDLDIEDAKIGKSRTAICRNRRGVVVEYIEAERPCTARARLPNGSAQQGPADAAPAGPWRHGEQVNDGHAARGGVNEPGREAVIGPLPSIEHKRAKHRRLAAEACDRPARFALGPIVKMLFFWSLRCGNEQIARVSRFEQPLVGRMHAEVPPDVVGSTVHLVGDISVEPLGSRKVVLRCSNDVHGAPVPRPATPSEAGCKND